MKKLSKTYTLSHINDPDIALQALKDGNKRFISGELLNQYVDFDHKKYLSEEGQAPHTIVLSCSDSRLLPKRVFDQAIGDLFMLRIAGNIVSPEEIGSMEFAVEIFKSCLIVIMGHQGCGAITAAVRSSSTEEGTSTKNIDSILNRLKKVVDATSEKRKTLSEEEYIDYCIDRNVKQGLKELTEQSEIIRNKMKEGKLKLVGAKYILETGEVVFGDIYEIDADL